MTEDNSLSLDDPTTTSLSDGQQIVLSLLFVCSGLMSIFGSATIIHKVVKSRKTKTYERLMLGLSCSDIVASLAYVLTPFLLPKETSERPWAGGNDVTCSVLGWLTQLGFAAIWYNGMLSYYYLATLKFTVSAENFAARFEPYIHGLTPFFFLFTATIGVPFHMFTEYRFGVGCWIADYPKGCEATGDCVNIPIGWIFGGFPLVFTFLSVAINNVLTYFHVRKILDAVESHNPSQELHIRRVSTQGLLYVASFLISYTPAFTVRILGANFGYRASDEADIFWLLVLNSLLLPLQGFFNMFIYTRPSFLRLKSAGTSNWTAMRGAFFHADIADFMTKTMGVAPPHGSITPSSPKIHPTTKESTAEQFTSLLESMKADSRAALLDSSEKFQIISDEGSTSEEPYSSESRSPQLTSKSVSKSPSSILKSSKHVHMDGSIRVSL